jgi:elongation factor 4
MEVFCQRLDDEFDAQVMITAPSVPYKSIQYISYRRSLFKLIFTFLVKIKGEKNIKLYGSEELIVTNASKLPNVSIISEYFEPMVIGTIITPDKYLTDITTLCMSRRGSQINSYYIDNTRLIVQFRFPLSEVIIDFYDSLKSVSSGYASFDYEDDGYEKTDLVKLDILLNDKPVEELSNIVHAKRARAYGKSICVKLKESLRRQQFKIKIQAAISGKFVAREDLKAYGKDVTAKLYGGDRTRRDKLLQRQTEGKKRLRMIGNIEVSSETFINVLKR